MNIFATQYTAWRPHRKYICLRLAYFLTLNPLITLTIPNVLLLSSKKHPLIRLLGPKSNHWLLCAEKISTLLKLSSSSCGRDSPSTTCQCLWSTACQVQLILHHLFCLHPSCLHLSCLHPVRICHRNAN